MEISLTSSLKEHSIKNKVKVLYLSAFPKYERLPFWVLMALHRLGRATFTAFLSGGEFCGFTYSVTVKGAHFIMFFAVEESLRFNGYGSAILSKIKSVYSSDDVVLNVEIPSEDAHNLSERLKRIEFYRKNGFFDTGYNVREVGGEFRVLATDGKFDFDAYKKVFRKFSFGFWDVWLKKEK